MTGSVVCLDVGSTNSRAWLVRDGTIVKAQSVAIGVRDSAREGSTDAVHAAVRDLVRGVAPADEPFAIVAAGMITSAQGLTEIPHVIAPTSSLDLARAAVMFAPADLPRPILLVPGVRTSGTAADLRGDVMRGEETLVLGLLATGVMRPSDVLLNAGSHWKLIAVDVDGRVARSRTSLGGEVVHAVQTGTLLAASLPGGALGSIQPEWLEAGADAARREGLFRAMFAVRLLDQAGDTLPEQRLAWLVGACISDDVSALLRCGLLNGGNRVLVSGPGAVPGAWAHLLRREGLDAFVIPADTVERAFIGGLHRILSLREGASAGEEVGS